jgi:hypothetical protein
MTPDQLVKEFLDANPHLVRAGNTGDGGGAGGGRSTTDGAGAPEIEAQKAKVKAAAEEALRSGSPRALVVHEQELKKLAELEKKGKAGA